KQPPKQCFDLQTYLIFNRNKLSFECPVCQSLAPVHDLLIDQFVAFLLKETSSAVDQVRIKNDGSWSPVEKERKNTNKNKNKPANNTKTINNNVSEIELPGSDDDDGTDSEEEMFCKKLK